MIIEHQYKKYYFIYSKRNHSTSSWMTELSFNAILFMVMLNLTYRECVKQNCENLEQFCSIFFFRERKFWWGLKRSVLRANVQKREVERVASLRLLTEFSTKTRGLSSSTSTGMSGRYLGSTSKTPPFCRGRKVICRLRCLVLPKP